MPRIYRYKRNAHETVFFHATRITVYSTARMKLKSILGGREQNMLYLYITPVHIQYALYYTI